jgi:hypothetical protein
MARTESSPEPARNPAPPRRQTLRTTEPDTTRAAPRNAGGAAPDRALALTPARMADQHSDATNNTAPNHRHIDYDTTRSMRTREVRNRSSTHAVATPATGQTGLSIGLIPPASGPIRISLSIRGARRAVRSTTAPLLLLVLRSQPGRNVLGAAALSGSSDPTDRSATCFGCCSARWTVIGAGEGDARSVYAPGRAGSSTSRVVWVVAASAR